MNGSYVTRGLAFVLATITILNLHAQSGYTVTERGPDYKVLEKTTVENGTNCVHRYVELATGLNYTNAAGQLVESSEQISILPTGGAAATQGRHKVYFPGNIYNGVIEVVTPDGRHLQSRPLGVSYDDGSNSVFIAELKSANGYLTSSNQVTYRDAFTGFKADLVCTYRRGGFECDLVFRQQPPTPGDFGLDDSFATLQLVTEFFNTPDPQQIPAGTDDWFGLQDSTLKFGKLTMTHGKAFAFKGTNSSLSTPNSQPATAVYKSWVHAQGRTFLIESVPVLNIADNLDALPLTAKNEKLETRSWKLAANKASNPSLLASRSTRRTFPPSSAPMACTNQIKLALADFNREPGVVLDYNEVDDGTAYTFGTGTYYINGNVGFSGTLTFGSGAVIKFDANSLMTLGSDCTVVCNNSPDLPTTFTSVNDDSIGDVLPFSNGSPNLMDTCGNLQIGDSSITLSNIDFLYCLCGIQGSWQEDGNTVDLWNCRFLPVDLAVVQVGLVGLHNVLLQEVNGDNPITSVDSAYAENVTYDCVDPWNYFPSGINYETNCLFVWEAADAQEQLFVPSGNVYVQTNEAWQYYNNTFSTSPIFQTGNKAHFYLAPGSLYRNAGTTAINPDLLAELQTMTTYAPQDGGFPDTNAPDLGYHYPVNEDSDHDGLPDWWEWHWFGSYAFSGTNLDDAGNTLLYDFQNGINPSNLSNTMVVGWLDDLYGESDVPYGLTNAIAISAGEYHSMALLNDGTVAAWGNGWWGETDVPTGLTNVLAICAGLHKSFAVQSNGTVVAWGNGNVLNPPSDLAGIKAVAAGWEHAVALRTNGTLVAWGSNELGQTNVPADLTNVIAIAACSDYSLALKSNGTVRAWGFYNTPSVPSGLSNVVAIAAGLNHCLALKNDGTVIAWGASFYHFGQADVPAGLTNVLAVAASWWHSMALKNDGTIVVWGDPNGLGPSISSPIDSKIFPVGGFNHVISISASGFHGLALRSGSATPIITQEPVDQYPLPGSTVVFQAEGWGLYGVTYQWQLNGVDISGANNANLTVNNVQSAQVGNSYRVVVTDVGGMGSIVSSNAVIYFLPTPTLVSQSPLPTNQIVTYLSTVNLGVVATAPRIYDGYPLSYQWQFNGVNISNATSSTYSFVAIAGAAGNYSVRISNAAGSINPGWQVTVVTTNGIHILQQPTDQYQSAGGTVSFISAAISSNAVSYQWQFNGTNISGATAATLTLTNVQAAQQGIYAVVVNDSIASQTSSNASFYLVTPPVFTSQSSPTNFVKIYGKYVSLSAVVTAPFQTNGFPLAYQWKLNGTNLAGVTSVNYSFFVNDTNVGAYSLVVTNYAGSASVSWQVSLTNAIDVTQDLLLIYNTNSQDSKTVLDYYLAHRPNVSGANVLGIGYVNTNAQYYYETITPIDFTNQIIAPVVSWLNSNPTKRPQYVILFMDLPSRVADYASTNVFYYQTGLHPSVSYQFQNFSANWQPYVTHLNMGMTNIVNRTNDCIGYINKLASLGIPTYSNSPVLSASLGGYANTNFILDNVRFADTDPNGEHYGSYGLYISSATNALLAAGVSSSAISYYDGVMTNRVFTNIFEDVMTWVRNGIVIKATNNALVIHATNAVNVGGYISWGVHGAINPIDTFDGAISWQGNSGWWLIETIESYNGQQYNIQGKYIDWYSSSAYGGTNYANTPIGAVSHTDEPNGNQNDVGKYFGLWATGKNFGVCAWASRLTQRFQAVGDPLITR